MDNRPHWFLRIGATALSGDLEGNRALVFEASEEPWAGTTSPGGDGGESSNSASFRGGMARVALAARGEATPRADQGRCRAHG